jgi:hypothetical protein
MPGSDKQNNMFEASPVKQFKQEGNPFPVTSCGRRRNDGSPLFKKKRKKSNEPRRTIGKGKNFNKVAKDKSARGGAAGGGMTEKGVKAYSRSFCARSRSWKSERGLAARRRWRC